MSTLLKRYGLAKKATSAKQQRARQRKAKAYSGAFMEKGNVIYAVQGSNSNPSNAALQGAFGDEMRDLLKAAGHLFTMGDPDDDLEDDPPPGVSPTRGAAA